MPSRKGLVHWVSRAFSEPDGTPSTKRILFAFVVVSCVAFCSGAYKREGMTSNIVNLLQSALYSTAAGYAVGRFAEQKTTAGASGRDPDPPAGGVVGALPAPIGGTDAP